MHGCFFYVGLKYTGNIFVCTPAISKGDNDETRLQNNHHVLGKLKAMLMNTYELSLSEMDCQVSSLILPCFPLAPAPFIFPNNLSSYFKTSSIRTICSSEDQLAPLFLFAADIKLSISFSAIFNQNNTQTTTFITCT